MRRYLLSRVLQAIITLWLLTLVAFVLTRYNWPPSHLTLELVAIYHQLA